MPILPRRHSPLFARAELVARWLTTPSPEIRLTVLAFDFPEGGSYRFAYQVPGATTVIVGRSYSVIKPPSRIVFSWVIGHRTNMPAFNRKLSVAITPDGSGCKLVIRHEKFKRTDAIERHAAGWRGAVDRLKEL